MIKQVSVSKRLWQVIRIKLICWILITIDIKWNEKRPRYCWILGWIFEKWKWFIYLLYLYTHINVFKSQEDFCWIEITHQQKTAQKYCWAYFVHQPQTGLQHNSCCCCLFFHSINLRCWAHVVLKTFPVFPFSPSLSVLCITFR